MTPSMFKRIMALNTRRYRMELLSSLNAPTICNRRGQSELSWAH